MSSTPKNRDKGRVAVAQRDRNGRPVTRCVPVAVSSAFPQVSATATATTTYRTRFGTVPAPTATAAPRPMGRRGCVPGAVHGLAGA